MTSVTSSTSRVITDSPVVVALDYNKRDAALAFVDGIINIAADGADPVLDLPARDPAGLWQQPAVIVGDLKLSQFRKILREAGMDAEFQEGGVLICNDGTVSVKKVGVLVLSCRPT